MSEPEKKKFSAKVSGLFGELKKVSWPSFSKVVAQTGVVLAVTLFFLIVLMAMDVGLNELYKLLISGLTETVLPAVTFNEPVSPLTALSSVPLL